jgi:hypothetical protein
MVLKERAMQCPIHEQNRRLVGEIAGGGDLGGDDDLE